MGLRIKVPGASFGGEYLNMIDPVLPEQGAVYLFEPGHPLAPWGSADPDPTTIVNLAESQALAMGLNTELFRGGSMGTTNKFELTAKHGAHWAHDPSDSVSGSGRFLSLPLTTADELRNRKHALYMSTWCLITEPNTGPANGTLYIFSAAGQHGMSWRKSGYAGINLSAYTSQMRKVGSGDLQFSTSGDFPTNQPLFLASFADLAQWYAAAPSHGFWTAASGGGNFNVMPFLMGNVGFQDGASRGDQGSQIYYRSYMEDLVVSGRTAAQARAADLKEYTRQVLTPGGRYYDDVWTPPATLLAGA